MSDENHGSRGLFRQYTESNCHFENKYLSLASNVSCIPWFMPRLDGDPRPVCNKADAKFFIDVMTNHDKNETRRCLQDCTLLEFEFIATSDAFDAGTVKNTRC